MALGRLARHALRVTSLRELFPSFLFPKFVGPLVGPPSILKARVINKNDPNPVDALYTIKGNTQSDFSVLVRKLVCASKVVRKFRVAQLDLGSEAFNKNRGQVICDRSVLYHGLTKPSFFETIASFCVKSGRSSQSCFSSCGVCTPIPGDQQRCRASNSRL